MTEYRTTFINVIKHIKAKGYNITARSNRKPARSTFVSFRVINEALKSLQDQANRTYYSPFIAAKKCDVIDVSDVEYFAESTYFTGKAKEDTGNTIYILFNVNAIADFHADPENILEDLALSIFEAIKRRISQGNYIELSVSVNYQTNPDHMPFVVNAGIMIEGVADT